MKFEFETLERELKKGVASVKIDDAEIKGTTDVMIVVAQRDELLQKLSVFAMAANGDHIEIGDLFESIKKKVFEDAKAVNEANKINWKEDCIKTYEAKQRAMKRHPDLQITGRPNADFIDDISEALEIAREDIN